MSGHWEVVGKKKEKNSKLPVAKTNTAIQKYKKVAVNDVNIEDVCK